MKLEEQVCALEYAKKLKEFGVNQDSLFYWSKWIEKYEVVMPMMGRNEDYISAFIASEIINLLPECIPNEGDLMMWNYMEGDVRIYGVDYCGSGYEAHKDIKFVDALAKQLIYLIENKLVEI
jgi:hypothetical protein